MISRVTMLSFIATVAAAGLAARSLNALEFWMTGAQLKGTFAGAAIAGEYVDGRTFNETYDTSGSLSYVEPTNSRDWSGSWSITNGRFCTIYDVSGTGGCFRVRRTSFNCFEFYFDTRTEAEARRSTLRTPTWTARARRTDTPSTCNERPMV